MILVSKGLYYLLKSFFFKGDLEKTCVNPNAFRTTYDTEKSLWILHLSLYEFKKHANEKLFLPLKLKDLRLLFFLEKSQNSKEMLSYDIHPS